MLPLTIPARFHGPAGSGNGGYSAGLLASRLSETDPVTVTLRVPPPLEVELAVVHSDEGVGLWNGDELVAEAALGQLEGTPPPPVPYDEALRASAGFLGLEQHPFPSCFACGPEHPDGLHLAPGRTGDVVAAPWVPVEVDRPTVWAALDCPSGWAVDIVGRPMVLGRITARVYRLPEPGDECVVVGWERSHEGRKALTGSVLYLGEELLAEARSTWIALKP